jgi:hypothetical protein
MGPVGSCGCIVLHVWASLAVQGITAVKVSGFGNSVFCLPVCQSAKLHSVFMPDWQSHPEVKHPQKH